jgi:hypothetical protein
VPQCINTWLSIVPKCTSNSDAKCFCPNKDFTDKVISCVQAWGASKEEIQNALSYFTGICAAWVPTNPGIVTAIPSTITLVPTVVPSGASGATASAGITAPAITSAPAAPCTTITYSTYTVTVPQVSFYTSTASGSATTVGLVPAGPSGASPANTGKVPSPVAASSTLVTAAQSSTPYVSSKATATATTSPIAFNSASTVSMASSLLLGSVAAFLGLML